METRKALGIMAGLVLVIGIALALWPTHVAGGKVGCGSAVSPDGTAAIGAEFGDALGDIYSGGDGSDGSDDGGYTSLCDDRIGSQRLIAFPVIGVAALGGLFLMLTSKGAPVQPAPKSEDSAATTS